MATCEQCGNDYDKSFTVTMGGRTMIFDSFECAIQALAPTCKQAWSTTAASLLRALRQAGRCNGPPGSGLAVSACCAVRLGAAAHTCTRI
jgi:hypothetical protein